MTKCLLAAACVVLAVVLVQTSLSASANSGKIESEAKDSGSIAGLTLDTNPTPVIIAHQREGRALTATLRGTFIRPEWSLIYKYHAGLDSALVHADGSFEMQIFPTSNRTPISLKAVGPLGKVEATEITFVIDDWERVEKDWHKSLPKLYGFTPSLGFTGASYSQSGASDYSGLLLNVKLAYGRSFALSPWSISASAFTSFLALIANTSDVQPRYLGLNARVGYVLPFPSRTWKASLMAGAYYATMFVTDHAFGYNNVSGPQLYPTLQKYFSNGDIGSIYMKYSPVSNSLGFLNLGNREIASGVSWAHALGSRSYSFNLDLANLHLDLSGIEIKSTTTTFSVGIGL